jgi:hypothetical protein
MQQQGDPSTMEGGCSKEQQMQIVCVRSASTGGDHQEAESRSALSLFKEKEEEIERKKLEVRDKVFSMLGRVEEESKRLAFIRQELEVMADPTRREVDAIRKRIDKVNKQLKPLGKTCLKKVLYLSVWYDDSYVPGASMLLIIDVDQQAGEGIQDVPRRLQREEQREGHARQQAHGGECSAHFYPLRPGFL